MNRESLLELDNILSSGNWDKYGQIDSVCESLSESKYLEKGYRLEYLDRMLSSKRRIFPIDFNDLTGCQRKDVMEFDSHLHHPDGTVIDGRTCFIYSDKVRDICYLGFFKKSDDDISKMTWDISYKLVFFIGSSKIILDYDVKRQYFFCFSFSKKR